VINADGTYIWYTSYAIDGIAKTGIWSSSQDPDYPLVLQDNDESFYWKVGFKSGVSSIWLVPITFSGKPTYFWYYGTLIQSLPGATTPSDVALPTVSLAVSPSSVTEDGTSNLIYTFTRTAPITNTLVVNYIISGSATNGTDYATIPATITFAAGVSTATVTVDPTVDTTVEVDETVVLQLAAPAFRKDVTPLNRTPGGLMEQFNASLQRGRQG